MFGFNDKAREIEFIQREERRKNILPGMEKQKLRRGMRVFVSHNKYDGTGCHCNTVHTITLKNKTHVQTSVPKFMGDGMKTVIVPLDEHEFYSATGMEEAA